MFDNILLIQDAVKCDIVSICINTIAVLSFMTQHILVVSITHDTEPTFKQTPLDRVNECQQDGS